MAPKPIPAFGLKMALFLQFLLLLVFFGLQLAAFWLVEPLGFDFSVQVVASTYLSAFLTTGVALVVARCLGLSLGVRAFAPMAFVRFCAGLLVFLLCSQFVFEYFDSTPMAFMDKLLAENGFWSVVVLVVVIAPMYEELFFRGVFFGLMTHADSRWTPKQQNLLAVVVSSGAFALVHLQYDLIGVVSVFVMALLFGFAKLHSGSLFLSMVLHAINNAVAMAVYLLERS